MTILGHHFFLSLNRLKIFLIFRTFIQVQTTFPMKNILSLMFLIIIGCAAQKHSYHMNLDSYLNKSEIDVVHNFGPADEVTTTDEGKILTYYRSFSGDSNIGLANISSNRGDNIDIMYTKKAGIIERRVMFYIDNFGRVYRWLMI